MCEFENLKMKFTLHGQRTTVQRPRLKRILAICLVLMAAAGYSQQSPMYTQYMFNPYALNPAIGGTVDYYQIRMVNRFQWLGFTDAPVTNSVSFFGPLSKKYKNMGVGGSILSDVVGPNSTNALYGSYSYNINLNEEMHLSGGLSLGMMQYKLDGTQLLAKNAAATDPSIQGLVDSKYLPDASVGFYLWTTDYQVGLSSDKLFNNSFKLFNETTSLNRLRSHIYLFGAYKFPINRKWFVEPSTMLKFVYPAMPQVDVNVKLIYKNLLWSALSFRTGDAISVMGGYYYAKRYYIGLAYDYSYTSIRRYNVGTVEFMFGYKFDKLK